MTEQFEIFAEMEGLPWSCLQLNEQSYLVKFLIKSNCYCLLLSDLNYFYFECLPNLEIRKRCEELNSGLEMPIDRILAHLQKTLYSCEKEASEILSLNQKEEEILLRLETCIAGVSFFWSFKLTKCNNALIKDQLLLPLIGMVAELQQQQAALISLIKKKDLEIEDYREQGIKASRRYLETGKFDEDEFYQERNNPQILSQIAKESVKCTFSTKNDDLYKAISSAYVLLKEQYKQVQNEKSNSKIIDEDQEVPQVNPKQKQPKIHSQQAEKDMEIVKRKQLEDKLAVMKKKRKKINL